MTWDVTRGQDANVYIATHASEARLFIFGWHDGYFEAHFSLDGDRKWSKQYPKRDKATLEQIQQELIERVEEFIGYCLGTP